MRTYSVQTTTPITGFGLLKIEADDHSIEAAMTSRRRTTSVHDSATDEQDAGEPVVRFWKSVGQKRELVAVIPLREVRSILVG